MNQTKRLLGYSVLLTLLYIIWLLPGYWNLGFTVINTLFLAVILAEYKNVAKDNFLKILWVLSLLLGVFLSIRSFEFVRFLSIVSILILDSMLVVISKKLKSKIDIGRLVRTEMKLPGLMIREIGRVVTLLLRLKNKTEGEKYQKIVKGVFLSIPLLFVFGSLFYSADPIFAKIVDLITWPQFRVDEKLFWNVVKTLLFFGFVRGMLRNKLVKQINKTKWLTSVTELNVAVLILEILFVAFSVVQIKYFLATPDDLKKMEIIFSEYTRYGYGQMLFASILAYLLVLRLEFAQRSIPNKMTKFLIWSMLAEILLFIVSATKRNYIYQSFYGYTEIRLLGFALSLWLVAMLWLLAYKVWQQRKTDFFTRGIILITAMSILGLNVFDIDGTIVRTRPASLDSGVDYEYMSNLSDDAWAGWEKIVVDAEEVLKTDTQDLFVYRNRIYSLDNLIIKKNRLELMSKNHWNWGGSVNYSAIRSQNYLHENEGRIKDVLVKLRLQKIRLENIENEKREVKLTEDRAKSFSECKNNIYQTLIKSNQGIVSINGEMVVLMAGPNLGPNEEAVLFNNISTATNGTRWLWSSSGKRYTFSCVR